MASPPQPGSARARKLEGTVVVEAAGPASRVEPTVGILTVMSGSETGRVVRIAPGRPVDLGRAPDNGVSFDDASVSGKHAQVMMLGSGYLFADSRSTNGSFVNEEKSSTPRPLVDGDRIQLGTSSFLRFSLVTEEEETALRANYEAGRRDGLTGVFNRKHLEERLEAAIHAALHVQQPLGLIMIDVDHFKKVNDGHGHLGGDAVLRGVAATFQANVREDDLLARYGGEEFTVVLPGTTLADSAALAEKLRVAIGELSVEHDGKTIRVTSSAGVAALDECSEHDRESLIGLADVRLYEAKNSGRNRVVSG